MKPQYKLFLALLFASFLIWILGGCAAYKPVKAPKIIQVRITELTRVNKKTADLKALSMGGDTVYLRYGFARKNRPYLGQWLTIFADSSDLQCIWNKARIEANN